MQTAASQYCYEFNAFLLGLVGGNLHHLCHGQLVYRVSWNTDVEMMYMHDSVGVMQVCKPKDFAMQINLHMENCWGIVRAVIDLCLKLDEGKYIIVKEPNKPVMRLYSVPEKAFEQVGFKCTFESVLEHCRLSWMCGVFHGLLQSTCMGLLKYIH